MTLATPADSGELNGPPSVSAMMKSGSLFNSKPSVLDDDGEEISADVNEYLKDETNAINTEMISRHSRFQKLFAKRIERVRRLNALVSKNVLEANEEGENITPEKVDAFMRDNIEGITLSTQRVSLAEKFDVDDDEEEAIFERERLERERIERDRMEAELKREKELQREKEIQREKELETQKLNLIVDEDEEEEAIPIKQRSQNLFYDEDEDDEDQENDLDKAKVAEIAAKKKDQRLMEELEREGRLLDELEAMLETHEKLVSEKILDKNSKELLEIAAKTQALSIKYSIDPIVYTRVEITKNDLLNDFNYSDNAFQHPKTVSSPLSKQSQFEETHNPETEASDVENLEKGKLSPTPLQRYTASLKQAATEGQIELGDSDSDSDSDMLPKLKILSLKAKYAKRKAPEIALREERAKRGSNLTKFELANLMMQRHNEVIQKTRFEEEEEELERMIAEEGEEKVSAEKLFETAMAFELRRGEKEMGELEEEDLDYEGEVEESGEEGESGDEAEEAEEAEKAEEAEAEEANDQKDKPEETQKDSEPNEADSDEEQFMEIKYNTDPEEPVVRPKKLYRKDTLIDEEEEEEDEEEEGPEAGSSILMDLQTQKNMASNVSQTQISLSNVFLAPEGGLTQQIKGIFGDKSDILASSASQGVPRDADVLPTLGDQSFGETLGTEEISQRQAPQESFVVGFDIGTNQTETQNDMVEKEESDEEEEEERIRPRRLVKKAEVETESSEKDSEQVSESESESEIDEEEKERLIVEANRRAFQEERLRELQKRRKELEMKKSGLGDILEQEAEESEDEYAGYGGHDKDDLDAPDSEDERMIDDITKVKRSDDEALKRYVQNEAIKEDQEILERIKKDIETGRLGRRRGDFLDVDDEDYADELERLRFLRSRKERQRRLLEESSDLAKNKKTRAFFELISEDPVTVNVVLDSVELIKAGDKTVLSEESVKRQISSVLESDNEESDNGDSESEDELTKLKLGSVFCKKIGVKRIKTTHEWRASLAAIASFRSLQELNKQRITEGRAMVKIGASLVTRKVVKGGQKSKSFFDRS